MVASLVAERDEEVQRNAEVRRLILNNDRDGVMKWAKGLVLRQDSPRFTVESEEVDALRAEVEQLREDAERYRWLRDHGLRRLIPAQSGTQLDGRGPYITMTIPGTRPCPVALEGVTTDAAIDAARKALE
jgi:hypothetical protein